MTNTKASKPHVAIVDYGLGNLFSVKHACEFVGMSPEITSDAKTVLGAEAVVLPGVGAFGDAMDNLRRLDLVAPLRELSSGPTPLVGICLGMQLLMSESSEFGRHEGLDIVRGSVVRFDPPCCGDRVLKVPQVGWNTIHAVGGVASWEGTLLQGLQDGEFMYFVHSYYVRPQDSGVRLAMSRYGDIDFCSTLRHRNVFGFQFHPERSAREGLRIYCALADMIIRCRESVEKAR